MISDNWRRFLFLKNIMQELIIVLSCCYFSFDDFLILNVIFPIISSKYFDDWKNFCFRYLGL